MRHLSFLAGFAFLFGLWFIAADMGHLVSAQLLPPLGSVISRLMDMGQGTVLWGDAFATLWRWFCGVSLGVVCGTCAGLGLGVAPGLYRVLEGVIEFFRAMPVTALFPLFLVVFGLGDVSKIAMAFFPTFLLMLVNASYGVLHASAERRRVARILGANPWQVFRYVVVFDALPQIFVGFRLALSLSLVVTVVAEMFVGTDQGLGQRIYESYLTGAVTSLYALLLVLGGFGYALNKASMAVEKRVIHWAGRG